MVNIASVTGKHTTKMPDFDHKADTRAKVTPLLIPGILSVVILSFIGGLTVYHVRSECYTMRSELALMKTDLELLRQESLDFLFKDNRIDAVDDYDDDAGEEVVEGEEQEEDEEEEVLTKDEQIVDANDEQFTSLVSQARFRRDVNESHKKKKKNDAKKNKKKKKSNIEAVHLIPKLKYMKGIKEGRFQYDDNVDCGVITRYGLQVDCEILNIWQLDSEDLYESKLSVTVVNGVVVIEKPGLYYIYSQVTNHDTMETRSYNVTRRRDQEDATLSQCMSVTRPAMSSSNIRKVYPTQYQCHTSFSVRLKKGDQIFIQDQYYDRARSIIKLDKHLTFWGLIRLTD